MDYNEALAAVEKAASDRNREITRLRLEENLTYKQIGSRYGISRARAFQIVEEYLRAHTHPGKRPEAL